MAWHSAEALFSDDPDDPGPAFGGVLFALSTRQILKPVSSHGSTAFTAVYRCQAPDPDCDCSNCWKERSKAKRAAPKN